MKRTIAIVVTSLLLIGSIILYFVFANMTYKVTFIFNNGSANNIVNVSRKSTVKSIEEPVKEGYTFEGWYLNGELYDFNNIVKGDITLNAVWKEYVNPNEVTVTFETNGGTLIPAQKLMKGQKIDKPIDPVREGYIFVEWQLNKIKYDFENGVLANMKLIALWEEDTSVKRYTVTFNTDGGTSLKSIKVVENGLLTKPTNPTKNGYIFDYWQLNASEYDFSSKVTKDITLKAIWRDKSSVKTYTVIFDSAGGSSVPTATIEENDKVAKPSNPTKENYTFVSWKLSGSEYNFDKEVTKNITLIAQWKENDKVTVSFNSDGGSIVPSRQVYKGKNLGTLPDNPTKNGFTFDGWYSGPTKFTSSSLINDPITLTAKWIDNNEVALNNAKNAINASYNITASGQQVAPTYNGCTITHTNSQVLTKITRGLTDSNITLTFDIACGNKTGTKSVTGVIKASPYGYTAQANANMQNYDLTIKEGNNNANVNGTLYSLSGEYLSDITNGKAIINNSNITNYPDFKIVLSDSNTIYVIGNK